MTRIPEKDRDMMELSIYLPMVLTVLTLDRTIIENSHFKLKQPYLDLIETTIKDIQKELYKVKRYMAKHNLKVEKIGHDDAFTMFLFLYKGYEEQHNYFNPRIRNKVQELLTYYLFKRYTITENSQTPF